MYSSNIGLPSILINFRTAASTAMIRSSRGVVSLILNEEGQTNEDGVIYFKVNNAGDIPSTLSNSNKDLIKKALLGTPLQINVFTIPPAEYQGVRSYEEEVMTEVESTTTVIQEVDEFGDDDEVTTTTETREVPTTVTVVTTTIVTEATIIEATVTLADALKQAGDIPCNWIAYPTGGAQGQDDLATWVKSERKDNNKTYKAVVANVAADDYGVVNFTTERIRVVNPDYTDALLEVGGDSSQVPEDIPQYNIYSAEQYTARLAGLLAGISLDRSATYFTLSEVVDCKKYDGIENHIDKGELCLFDEHDGEGVKIARAINSLVTFTANIGDDFRHIKTVEAIDMIKDDISNTFRKDYVGKVLNSYENKALLISAINIYLNQLRGTILDNADSAENYVEIDTQANADYAAVRGIDTSDFSDQQLKEINTGSFVFLRGRITVLNALEDLELEFVLA